MRRSAAICIALVLLAGCQATPPPQPSPTPESVYAAVPDPVKMYLAQVQPFDSPEAIMQAQDIPARTLLRIVAVLETIVPPPEMQAAHIELLEGYRCVLEGRTILESTTEGVARSEGWFLSGWGLKRLREHETMVFAYLLRMEQ